MYAPAATTSQGSPTHVRLRRSVNSVACGVEVTHNIILKNNLQDMSYNSNI